MRGALFLLAALAILLCMPAASSHQPRLSIGLDIHDENSSLLVPYPEISKAYYGELTGKPDYYTIVLERPSRIYIGITAPATPGSRTDFSVEAYDYKDRSVTRVILLDGARFQWTPFYEPFGGDWYLRGPEARENLTNTTYFIKVSGPSNQGKYSLTIGEEEAFSPLETLNSLVLLPAIKERFFGKPVIFPFFHYLGISMALGAAFSAAALVITGRRAGPRIPGAYRKVRYVLWLGLLITTGCLIAAFIMNPLSFLGNARAALFILILLLSWRIDARIRAMEDNKPSGWLKFLAVLSILFWLAFLLLAVAAF
jgi:hypothetical protein